jgi:hypothetical protein
MARVTASRIPRIRGIWLAGLVALSLLTFGIVPHSAAAGRASTPSAPVAQAASHVDPVVFTRAPTSHGAIVKTPAPYGDLVVGATLFGLVAWLFAGRRGHDRAPRLVRRGPRLSRAPPLTA